MTLMKRMLALGALSAGLLMLAVSTGPVASAVWSEDMPNRVDQSDQAQLDLTGGWSFYVTRDGTRYEEVVQHMHVAQEASTLTLNATCDPGFPTGTGTLDGRLFSFSFDLGGGASLDAWGRAKTDELTGQFSTPDGGGGLRAERTGPLDCGPACDPVPVPRLVEVDYVDLTLVEQISKFRSGHGHDYADLCETCRSMKQYYYFYDEYRTGNGVIEIRSPVDGLIVRVIDDSWHGASPGLENKEILVRSSLYPTIFFVLSHVDLRTAGVRAGKRVRAGDVLGHARLYYPDLGELARGTEIAVMVHTPWGRRFVPFFDTMADSLFATYVARGVTSREDLVISKEARDADALTCLGEEFVSPGTLENWVYLRRP